MSETTMLVSNPYQGHRKRRRHGWTALAGRFEVRVVDHDSKPCPQGEIGGIEVRSECVSRLLCMPEKPPRNLRMELLKTGDVGRFDETVI